MAGSKQSNVLSVSQLSQLIRRALETNVGRVWVEGEVSSATLAQSGHLYLTLKDANSQIRGIIWRSTLERLKVEVEPGQKILCLGSIEVYPPRGEYQIVIDRVEQTGLGALQLAFRKLHERLQKEGLFKPDYKKPLPRIPRHIGVVTSPGGAAIFDFLKVLLRRWPSMQVTILPVSVQGPDAKIEIAKAVLAANRMRQKFDALVVTRGGGSLEDLWAFNEEVVVRAIYESEIPVMSAVGHEIDVTLSDLVADQRAATPSEAAEKIVPDYFALRRGIQETAARLQNGIRGMLGQYRERLDWIANASAFNRPKEAIELRARQVDEMDQRLRRQIQLVLKTNQARLEHATRSLAAVSPLGVLARGYSITQDEKGNTLLDAKQVQSGDWIQTVLSNGKLTSRVEKK